MIFVVCNIDLHFVIYAKTRQMKFLFSSSAHQMA